MPKLALTLRGVRNHAQLVQSLSRPPILFSSLSSFASFAITVQQAQSLLDAVGIVLTFYIIQHLLGEYDVLTVAI